MFSQLDAEFGFALDAAAVAGNAKCASWFGPDHPDPDRRDGLTVAWDVGPVWLNPPYGRGIDRWMAKADQTAEAGVVVVCLVPARVDTGWFHDWCLGHEVRFIRRRLKFNGHAKEAPFASCVVVMRGTASRCACGAPLNGRSDKRYCSTTCRVRAHRSVAGTSS